MDEKEFGGNKSKIFGDDELVINTFQGLVLKVALWRKMNNEILKNK